MPYSVFEAAFHLPLKKSGEKNQILSILENSGISPQEIVESSYKSKLKISCYFQKRSKAAVIKQHYKKTVLRGISLKIKLLKREDWLDKWQNQYRPFNLGKGLRIIPAWKKDPVQFSSKRIRILLDPGAAFGSGTHETTKLMIQMMEEIKKRSDFKNFLDAGTGTGILSISAEKMGAKKINAFDSDSTSVQDANDNLKLNGCKTRATHLSLENLRSKPIWDIVAGNLISQCLVDHQKILAYSVKPSGYLLVSGILNRNLPGFLKEFKPSGIRRIKFFRGRSWAGIIYRKQ